MKNIHFLLLFSFLFSSSFAQRIDPVSGAMQELRTVVETAARSGQRVLVDDFTALDCYYCPFASFAVSDMLDEYPETLISVQWHLPGFMTPDSSDFDDCIYNNEIGECFEARADYYGWDTLMAIPFEVFNGAELVLGATSEDSAYNSYVPIYQSLVGTASPYEIFIDGTKDSLNVDYEITVSLEADTSIENQKVHIIVVEDNILSDWQGVNHNARNVARHWIASEDLTITSSGETQTFSGSLTIDGDGWNPDSIKIISMVQNNDNADIFQVQDINVNNFPSQLGVEHVRIPQKYVLHQNYPNPFNPVTTLRYDLQENSLVNITIHDILGRQVKTLINQTQDAGYRSVIWNATNDYGKPVSAGIYLYQIQTGEYISTKKMVLLK